MFDVNFEICGITIFLNFSEERYRERILEFVPLGAVPKNYEPDFVIIVKWGKSDVGSTLKVLDVTNKTEETSDPTLDDSEVISYIESKIKFFVSRFSRTHIAIHAGCVRIENKTLLFPASGYRGKSTLTSGFVRNGAQFYSDDLAIFDLNGNIVPFSKKISLRDEKDRKTFFTPENLGGTQAKSASEIDFVFFTEYKYRGYAWKPRKLSTVNGKIELLKHVLTLAKNPHLSMEILDRIVGESSFIKGNRGETEDFYNSIQKYIAQ